MDANGIEVLQLQNLILQMIFQDVR